MGKNKSLTKPIIEEPIVEEPRVVETKVRHGIVSAALLNCRVTPSLDGELCEFGPLERNTKVEIIETEGDWFKVLTEKGECYLLGEHVKTIN